MTSSMMMTASTTPADPTSTRLAELRAAIAAEGARTGLTGMVIAAILQLLDTLAALLADLRAGRLAAPAPAAGFDPAPVQPRAPGSGGGSGCARSTGAVARRPGEHRADRGAA